MVGSAGTSPKRTTSAGSDATEITPVPSHRRFNRPAAIYDRAITPERQLERQSPEPAIQPVFQPRRLPETKKRSVVPLFFLIVLLVAAGITFALAYFRDRQLTVADTTPGVQGMPAQGVRLGMRARQQGGDLLLSWDGKSQAVQSATDGLLQIDDGAQHRQIALDRSGIESCSMLYKPTSDDVVFRLEVRGKEGLRGAESLEVVGTAARATNAKAPPASAPVPEVTPEPNRPKVEKFLPAASPSNRRGSKIVNARASAQPVNRRSPKVNEPTARVPRTANQPVAAEKAPSLSLPNVTASQPSAFSGLQLPKPPPEPSPTAPKSANQATDTAGSPAKPSSPPRDSAATSGTNSAAPASYVPPRPLKWTAPNAKSLGIKIPAATDVQIKVRIDDSGHVTSAHALLDGSPHDEALTSAVTSAVKQWVFVPAKMQGKSVPSEETVVIRVGPRE